MAKCVQKTKPGSKRTSSFHVPLRSCSLPVERRRVRKASESTRQEKRELMRLTKMNLSRGGGEGNCEDERH